MGILLKMTLPDKPAFSRNPEPERLEKNRYRGGKLTIKFNRFSWLLSTMASRG
jgi:hypothetical protein